MVSLGSATKLKEHHENRPPGARKKDESNQHRVSVSLRDAHPLAAKNIAEWKKDPASLDIVEIDGLDAPKNMAKFKVKKLGSPKSLGLKVDPPKTASGKSKVSKANIARLEAAASDGPTELLHVANEIKRDLKAESKRAAIRSLAADLLAQIDHDGQYMTGDNPELYLEALVKAKEHQASQYAEKVGADKTESSPKLIQGQVPVKFKIPKAARDSAGEPKIPIGMFAKLHMYANNDPDMLDMAAGSFEQQLKDPQQQKALKAITAQFMKHVKKGEKVTL